MIEITAIITQFLFFLIIFSFPFNPVVLNNILNSKKYFFGVFDTLLVNAVFIFNFLIITSYLNLSLNTVFYILLTFSIINSIFYFNNWLTYIVKEKKNIIFFSILCLCIFFSFSNSLKFEWDGIAHWFFKTKSFYDGNSIDNIKNLPASMYPHLGTYLWAFFWKNSIVEYEYLGRLIYIFIYVLSIFSICCSIFNYKNFNNFLLFPIILFFITLTYDEYLFGGYQEYLLFSFIILMSKLILNIIDNNSSSIKELSILILTGNLLIYFKDEGIVYLFIIFFIFQFYLKNNLQKILVIASVIISISIQFFLEKNIIQVYGFQEELKINFDYIIDFKFIISNSILIFKYIIISCLKYPLWIITFISGYFLFKNKFDQKKLLLFFFLILAIFGFYFLLYIIHPHSSEFLMKVTLDRLLFQTSGFFIIYILISFKLIYLDINNYLKK